MKRLLRTIRDGFFHGLKITATLMKVVLPVYAVVVVLKYSPVMPFLERLFRPAMGLFLLPGEAVMPLLAGAFTDEYGAIATAVQFDFSTAQLTTIAMIGLVFHSIPVEFALCQRIGLPGGKLILYRFFAAIFIGFVTARIGGLYL
jgi:hypothetical protein